MIHLADVSEFQDTIDWPTYGRSYAAVIVRAHNGHRPDRRWAENRQGARANVAIRGWYHYLVKGSDAAEQAAEFSNTVAPLLPGEFVAVDVEEGSGSQVERAKLWMAVVDKTLNTRSWLYSYQAFAQAHLGSLIPFANRNVWLANYRSRPPDLPCVVWQHTDAEAHAGIRNPCDCSIYHGTAEQFAALVNTAAPDPHPLPPVVTFPEDHLMRIPVQLPHTTGGGGYWVLDGTQNPPHPGDDRTGYPRPAVPFDRWTGARPTVNGQYHKPPAGAEPSVTVCQSDNGFAEIGFAGFEPNSAPLLFLETAT
jgi:GH25 family lysozyme M1 (1,4-beta-N-acetylmuramidase)